MKTKRPYKDDYRETNLHLIEHQYRLKFAGYSRETPTASIAKSYANATMDINHINPQHHAN